MVLDVEIYYVFYCMKIVWLYDCMIFGIYFLNLIFGIILSRYYEVGGFLNGLFLISGLFLLYD